MWVMRWFGTRSVVMQAWAQTNAEREREEGRKGEGEKQTNTEKTETDTLTVSETAHGAQYQMALRQSEPHRLACWAIGRVIVLLLLEIKVATNAL